MASIKSVNRSASAAFSPESPFLAAGTMAGAVDLSFSSSAHLEIFKLDFQSDDQELPVVGVSPSAERFNRLSWGKTGSATEQFSLGLIAGGLVDGSINIWNPLSLIRSEENEGALVGRHLKHSGPVRGLEFNPNSPYHLASGSLEGEICIWDLANPTEPSLFPPLKSVGSGAQSEISYLSWNHKVQHILASTSYNGTTVVWDLKRQKPVISFTDSNRRRCSVLQWNPDAATQLIVASDDDASPSLRLWDVRNTISPVKEFLGHTKGVIGMSWCPTDSSLLLTCAKDNRTICWDTVTGEIVRELPVGTNWNFDIHWHPKIPGLISASSFDGNIGLYNIEGCSRSATGEADFNSAHLRAPKWLKCPVGASFGFGGKVVSFQPSRSASAGTSEVYVHDLVTELNLVNWSTEFEAAIQSGEKSSLRALCDTKAEESKSENDRETWTFLKVMFDEEAARTKLLAHLGYSVPDDTNAQNELSEELDAVNLNERLETKSGSFGDIVSSAFSIDNGEDFFNNLQSPKADPSPLHDGDNFIVGDVVPDGEQMHQESNGQGESAMSSLDESILNALVVGDYKGAVSHCISANKMADALVIAHVGGTSLWESTRDQYLRNNCSSYLKVVSAIAKNDLMGLVNSRPLNSWKETLALLCTFAEGKKWTELCDSLAARLMHAGNTLAATLCYICAGNIDKTVEMWSLHLKSGHEEATYIDLLQDLMEKTIVLALASGQKRFSASLTKLVENYAELLASQGLLKTAMEYLKLLGTEESSQELAILRDRIALAAKETAAPETSHLENTQIQTESVYNANQPGYDVAGSSQHYYQTQTQQSVAPSPYGDYQQPISSSYGGGYASAAYQPSQAPQMFMPSQTSQVPQGNYGPPVTSQPPVRPFVPATPTPRNFEQFQRPTLGSQLYPGVAKPPHHAVPPTSASIGSVPSQASVPGLNLPQVAAPTPAPAPAPAPTSFMPIPNSGFAQRPTMGMMQPPSPTQPAQVAPAVAPVAPPPTVQTADTSNVPAHLRPVITTLTRLFNETSEVLGGLHANPAKRREIEDNSRKIGALFAKLNGGDISQNAADRLVQLCQALDINDFGTAVQIQVVMTTSEWDECNFWLSTLKRMIKLRQNAAMVR